MSEWLEATREVYKAGGRLMPCKATQPHSGYTEARRRGFIAPVNRGGTPKPAVITQRGIDLIEGRMATIRTPRKVRLVATWLMALPRTNEVRL